MAENSNSKSFFILRNTLNPDKYTYKVVSGGTDILDILNGWEIASREFDDEDVAKLNCLAVENNLSSTLFEEMFRSKEEGRDEMLKDIRRGVYTASGQLVKMLNWGILLKYSSDVIPDVIKDLAALDAIDGLNEGDDFTKAYTDYLREVISVYTSAEKEYSLCNATCTLTSFLDNLKYGRELSQSFEDGDEPVGLGEPDDPEDTLLKGWRL
jgi:hypothetical protein